MQCFPDIKTRYSLRKNQTIDISGRLGILPKDEKAKLEKVNSEVYGLFSHSIRESCFIITVNRVHLEEVNFSALQLGWGVKTHGGDRGGTVGSDIAAGAKALLPVLEHEQCAQLLLP